MLSFENIYKLKRKLKLMEEMKNDLNKKLFCLGIITYALEKYNEKIILFGGSAVEYYSFGSYEGNDIDIFGTNENKIFEVLKKLGFSSEGSCDHWHLDYLPWTIHYAFTEKTLVNEKIRTITINEEYKIHIVRVEDIIIDQLRKIEGGYDSNLYYALARDMIEYNENDIDFDYLHELASNGGEKLMCILRTIEALLNLEVDWG